MSRKKRALGLAACAAASIAFVESTNAGVTVTPYTGPVTGSGLGEYWPSSSTGPAPSSAVGYDPTIDSGDGISTGSPNNDGQTEVTEQVGSGAFSVLAQTFQVGATGFDLGEIAF